VGRKFSTPATGVGVWPNNRGCGGGPPLVPPHPHPFSPPAKVFAEKRCPSGPRKPISPTPPRRAKGRVFPSLKPPPETGPGLGALFSQGINRYLGPVHGRDR